MKKVILVVLALILVIVLYFMFSTSKVERPMKVEKAIKVETAIKTVSKNVKAKIEEDEFPLLEIKDDEENLTIDELLVAENQVPEEDVSEKLEDEIVDIMVESSMDEVEKSFPLKEGITPVSAINLPQQSIANLNVGDIVSLPNMGTGEFNAKINTKKTHKNGSVTLTGNLVDSGNKYAVVLTEGKNMSFGTVTTPNGSFEIETRNGVGYVYATDAIDRAYIDHTQTDVIIPQE